MTTARYRKKPVEVEAIQWQGLGLGTGDVIDFAGTHPDPDSGEETLTFVPLAYPAPQLWVAANQAWVTVEPGEWLIRDARGVYPCKPDIFEQTYELVNDA